MRKLNPKEIKKLKVGSKVYVKFKHHNLQNNVKQKYEGIVEIHSNDEMEFCFKTETVFVGFYWKDNELTSKVRHIKQECSFYKYEKLNKYKFINA